MLMTPEVWAAVQPGVCIYILTVQRQLTGFTGLRQQPPQRILFQPEVSSTRGLRHSSSHGQSPQPSNQVNQVSQVSNYNFSTPYQSNNFSIANYEPRPQMPMTLRPVLTPGNNYPAFQANIKRVQEAKRVALGFSLPPTQANMKPGKGYDGPNIYARIQQGLRCPLPDEQDYALHHLVKISHERGDKYRFDAFPGLAEGLLEYLLKVGSLFYDVEWEVSYTEDEHELNTLDGINGTPDILQRIQSLTRIDTNDHLESEAFDRDLTKVSEATLTVRNMALLEENSYYLSDLPPLRDYLSIALNLPDLPQATEIKHYALDIAEQVTRCWKMDPDDPLYISLLKQVEDGRDRGAILVAIRALCRISLALEDQNLLEGVPTTVLRRMFEWLVLEDEELVTVCLDFFYQYTANLENINFLLSHSNELPLNPFLGQLVRLLQYGSHTTQMKVPLTKSISPIPATEIVTAPADLMEQFLKYTEPERSNQWLRATFEEDPESNVTQIALWQAYQLRFTEHVTAQTGLLPAAEFIKNVSTIFAGANAQVVTGTHQKFIIKGIRPRHAPVDSKGHAYNRCQWRTPGGGQCTEFALKAKHMFEHIAHAHFGARRKVDGTWDLVSASNHYKRPDDCYWSNCRHFSRKDSHSPSLLELGVHVKTHLPDNSSKSAARQRYNRTQANQTSVSAGAKNASDGVPDFDPDKGKDATYKYLTFQNTNIDEYGNPFGIPFNSIMILRNVARNVPRAVALSHRSDEDHERKRWMETLLVPLQDRLLYILAHNRALVSHVSDVVAWIEKGTAE